MSISAGRHYHSLLGTASCGEALSSGWWGVCCNGRRAKESGSPSTPHLVETASAAPSVAPQGGATGTSNASTGPDHRTPLTHGTRPPCSRTSPTAGLERPASMNPVSRMKASSCCGVPVPGTNTVPGFALASYAARTGPPTIAEAMAGILAERARMGRQPGEYWGGGGGRGQIQFTL